MLANMFAMNMLCYVGLFTCLQSIGTFDIMNANLDCVSLFITLQSVYYTEIWGKQAITANFSMWILHFCLNLLLLP